MRLAARTEPADGGGEAQKVRYCTVWKLDRFGRSLRHLVNALADFESLNIAFVSLSDNLDLSTASGRLMFNIIGAMAEFERALIQERVRAGIRDARAIVDTYLLNWFLGSRNQKMFRRLADIPQL